MFKRNLAITLAAVLLSAAGAAQASTSTFPTAAEEGSGFSVNAPLPAAVSGLSGADSVFPSAALEGGEHNGQYAGHTTPRNLERSYAGGHGSVFPSAAME
jgi:hypothetical protein